MKIYYHIDLENIKNIIVIREEYINLPKAFIVTFMLDDYYLFNKFENLLSKNFKNFLLLPNIVESERKKDICDDYLIKYCKDNYNILNNNMNVLISHDTKLQKRFKSIFTDGVVLNTPRNSFVTSEGIRYGSISIFYEYKFK